VKSSRQKLLLWPFSELEVELFQCLREEISRQKHFIVVVRSFGALLPRGGDLFVYRNDILICQNCYLWLCQLYRGQQQCGHIENTIQVLAFAFIRGSKARAANKFELISSFSRSFSSTNEVDIIFIAIKQRAPQQCAEKK
jgi:hypothetical protein